jgi:adenylylsulfate kinase
MHPKTIWLFGLPCSGKTTIAKQLIKGVKSIHLDGDIVRATLCSDLGFSPEDRMINIRRIAQVCQILNEQGITCTCSFVTPLESHREALRGIIDNLQLVYVNCPLDDCIERDVKGMYKKAKTGEILL